MTGPFSAFLSYTRDDDEYVDGAITELAKRLERALRAFTGRKDVAVFFDREDIEWGDAWRERIRQGLDSSVCLIAIISPSYLASPECRNEVTEFVDQPGEMRRFLPLYYIDIEDFDNRDDPVLELARRYQYSDWRKLRSTEPSSPEVLKAIDVLAKRIRDLMRESTTREPSDPGPSPTDPSRDFRAQSTDAGEADDWVDTAIAARAALEDEEYGLARALLLDALDSNTRPELFHELAVVDWYDGALNDAVEEFRAALDGGIPREDVLQGLGQVRVEMGDFEQGVADLTEVIDSGEFDEVSVAYSRSTRALGLGGLGRLDEALDELRKAEKVTPQNSWLHFNRAIVLDWADDDAAVESYVRSLTCADPSLNRPKRIFAQDRLRDLGWPD